VRQLTELPEMIVPRPKTATTPPHLAGINDAFSDFQLLNFYPLMGRAEPEAEPRSKITARIPKKEMAVMWQ
jgi:hypothetical protein